MNAYRFWARLLRATVAMAVLGGLLAGRCAGDSEGGPLETVRGLLSEGSISSTLSQNDPRTDGAATIVLDSRFAGDLASVQAMVEERFAGEGFELACPGGSDSEAPAGQDIGSDPRRKCGVEGNDVDGTIWLSSTPGEEIINLSAIVRS